MQIYLYHKPRLLNNMGNEFVPPEYLKDAFCCPHCGAYAHQNWYTRVLADGPRVMAIEMNGVDFNLCFHCNGYSIWVNSKLIYPMSFSTPLPVENMPSDVLEDFNEARSIVDLSPRAAAALLRLALEKLMIDLGAEGKDLNSRIGNLVTKGLPKRLQEAADALRVIGNNAVHPGVLDLNDDSETAIRLFSLLNLIVEYMITKPNEINKLYEKIPIKVLAAIDKRDSNATPANSTQL